MMNTSNGLEIEEGVGAKGGKYFFVRTDKGVVAAFDKSQVDAYILDVNSVEFKPSTPQSGSWMWIKRLLYTPNAQAVQEFNSTTNTTGLAASGLSLTLTDDVRGKLQAFRSNLLVMLSDVDNILK